MNNPTHLRQLVWLKLIRSFTARDYRNGLMAFGSLNELLNAPSQEWGKVEGLERIKKPDVQSAKLWKEVDREIERAGAEGVVLLSHEDVRYPSLLKEIYDPPFLLYVKGALPSSDRVHLALVGSRDASSHGLRMTETMAHDLAAAGAVVVSGLARGVDSAAHRGSLAAKGLTVAVQGCGLSQVYPSENRRLAKEIVSSGGAVISEFPMQAGPLQIHFPMRNRIISGMSRAVVVVEAREKSGSLITADCALEQGRDVYAVPANAEQTKAMGSNLLLGQGARLALGSATLIKDFGLKPIPAAGRKPKVALPKLNGEEARLLAVLKKAPSMALDEILVRGGYSAPQAMVLLTALSLKGAVKELPGKFFAEV